MEISVIQEAKDKLKEVFNRSPFYLFEHIFVVISLIRYSQGLLEIILMNGASEGDGSDVLSFDYKLSVAIYFLNYVITGVLLLLRWRRVVSALMVAPAVTLLIAIVPLSFLWSIEPSKTLSASIAMIGTLQFGLYIAIRYTLRDQVRIMAVMFAISMFFCFIYGIFLRKYGVMAGAHPGKWRGIYTHKNQMGKMMALSSGLSILIGMTEPQKRHRRLGWIGLFVALVLIQLSQSKSPIINIFLITLVSNISQILLLSNKWLTRALIWLTVLGVNLNLYWDDIVVNVLGALGKDATLTGRTDVWEFVIDRIKDRPWLGHGFGTFWNGLNGPSAYVVRSVRWDVPDAHNGFLDLCIDLGLVGLALYAFILFQTLIKTLTLIRVTRRREYMWALIFIVYSLIANLSESSLLFRNSLPPVVLTAVSVSIAIEYHKEFKMPRSSSATEDSIEQPIDDPLDRIDRSDDPSTIPNLASDASGGLSAIAQPFAPSPMDRPGELPPQADSSPG
jgi:O-antigen ligase